MNDALIIISLIILSAIFLSKIASKTGIPALLVFIIVGLLISPDGLGIFHFDNFLIAQHIGIVSLAYILFMGGISVNIKEIRPVFTEGLSLATIGVFLTAIIFGVIAYWFLHFSFLECLLLGSIVSSTDAAAVFSVLRSKNISLKAPLKPLLEFESGSNDPMAVFLTVGMIGLITHRISGFGELGLLFIKQMLIGALSGIILAKIAVRIINKIKLDYEGLYVVLTLAFVGFIFGFSAKIGGNGFLSVYVAGLTMAGSRFVQKSNLIKFHDGIAWIMQILMFLLLGVIVFIQELYQVAWEAVLCALILIFVARPIAVFLSMAFFNTSIRKKIFISWVGLRGAAPIVLATFPLIDNIPNSHEIFNVVFFVVLVSIIIQGTTIPYVAKILKLDAPLIEIKHPLSFESDDNTNELIEIFVKKDSGVIGQLICGIGLPENALVVMILRDEKFLIPSGEMELKENDILFIITDKKNQKLLQEIFSGNFD